MSQTDLLNRSER